MSVPLMRMCAGSLFWQWAGYSGAAPRDDGSNILESDSTYQVGWEKRWSEPDAAGLDACLGFWVDGGNP